MSSLPIYLDHHSTTPINPEVLLSIQPYFETLFGNASSVSHAFGWDAKKAVDDARDILTELLGFLNPDNLIFTSGTTESNNLFLKGFYFGGGRPFHLITQKTEHECVLQTCDFLERQGCSVTILDVDEDGFVNPADLQKAITPETRLVSIMTANHEIGTLQNISELAKVAHKNEGVFFHTDAAQAIGKVSFDAQKLGVDAVSFSAHKVYGPKGVGALYLAPYLNKGLWAPLFHGGGQEAGLRSGTLNVPGIVGLAKAVSVAVDRLESDAKTQMTLRDRLIDLVLERIPFSHLNGPRQNRLPGNANLRFDYIDAGKLMLAMPEIAVSSGAACASAKPKPSYVLQALGQSPEQAQSSLRFGLGRSTTNEDILRAVEVLEKAVQKQRESSLEYEMALQNL